MVTNSVACGGRGDQIGHVVSKGNLSDVKREEGVKSVVHSTRTSKDRLAKTGTKLIVLVGILRKMMGIYL